MNRGETYKLSDFKGQPIVMNYWGTFCPPCIEEMPAIQKQHEKWQDQGVVVIGINLGEDRVRVNSFVEQHGITFLILMDRNLQVARNYGVSYYPTTFFIDERGRIAQKVETLMY